jgi:hypothetical protein
MTMASIEPFLEILSFLLDFVALARVVQLRLVRLYPFFSLFLFIFLIPQAARLLYGSASRNYFEVWEYAEPVRCIVYMLVVWELFSVIFRDYAGLRSLSKWVMGAAAAIAPLGFVLTIAAPTSRLTYDVTRTIVRFERGIAFSLVIFILILLFFISRYPIRLPRNNIVHTMLYSIWFLGDAAILLISSYVPETWGYTAVNSSLAVLGIGAYLGWAILLTKAGEVQQTRVRQHISPELERTLIGELDAMNQVLVRAGRSISHSRPGGS